MFQALQHLNIGVNAEQNVELIASRKVFRDIIITSRINIEGQENRDHKNPQDTASR